ncbi:MAG: hypothetical protein JJV99_03265 [Colwellia sp.]|nr:hypothetical protein [Colwellia sp.]
MEDKIQNLVSDVYIQIEETLTQIISTDLPKEPSNNTSAEQEGNLAERLNIVEQQRENSVHKLQEAKLMWQKTDEIKTQALIEQKKQTVEVTQQLNIAQNDLKHIQEQHTQQVTKKTQDTEQITKSLTQQLQQRKNEAEDQKELITNQQEQQVFLESEIKQHVKISQEYKQEIVQNNEDFAKLKLQQLEEKKCFSQQEKQADQKQALTTQQLVALTTKNQELVDSLITEQTNIKLYQKEVSSLKSQVNLAQKGQENILNRYNASREKQEKDNNQVRETIKYLRDENSDMVTQHNKHKEQFMEQIHDLEGKLTEYRLKFEYAKKQLTQNN